jgi:hypothetical protein
VWCFTVSPLRKKNQKGDINRAEKSNFISAFQTTLSSDYLSENEDLTLVACGPMVA